MSRAFHGLGISLYSSKSTLKRNPRKRRAAATQVRAVGPMRCRRYAALWCAAAGMMAATDASAANKAYVGASGSFWSGNANWNPVNVPVNGDTVTIGQNLAANFILNFD